MDWTLSFSQALASPLGTSLCHLFMSLVSPDPLPAPRTPSQAQAASQGGGEATGYHSHKYPHLSSAATVTGNKMTS